MKKIYLLLISSVLVLSACSEKTAEEYQKEYDNSERSAQEKLQDCQTKLADAAKEKDKEGYKKIKENIGCKIAYKAVKKHKIAKKNAKKAAEKTENTKLLSEAQVAIKKEYGTLDWKSFAKIYKEDSCRKIRVPSYGKINTEQAKCQAMTTHYDQLIKGAQESFASMPFEEFLKMEKNVCQLDKSKHSACGVWQTSFPLAVEKQFNEMTFESFFDEKNHYCSNEFKSEFKYNICNTFNTLFAEKLKSQIELYNDDADFKKAYNACYEKSKSTEKRNYASKGQTLARYDATCHVVNKATNKRRLFDLNSFKKPLQ